MELDDLLLDGVFAHEAKHRYRALLTDTVRAVGGLIFHGGVPPGVEVDDVVGGREGEARSTSLEADEEYVAFAALKGLDGLVALLTRRAAVEVLVIDAFLLHPVFHQFEVTDELGEDEDLVAALGDFADGFGEEFQLGTPDVHVRVYHLRMAGRLAELHQLSQDLEAAVLPVALVDAFECPLTQSFVKGTLLVGKFHGEGDLRFRWQFFQHLFLPPPQNKGLNKPAQLLPPLVVVVFRDRYRVLLVEALKISEQAGVQELEEIPQFSEVVFDRRTGGGYPEITLEAHRYLAALRTAVLDRLGFIQDDGAEALRRQCFPLKGKQTIADHQHIIRAYRFDGFLAVSLPQQHRIQGRGEFCGFPDPVSGHGGGCNDERGAKLRAGLQHRKTLNGLTQAHVIRKAGTDAPVSQAHQPAETIQLVGPQLRPESRRYTGDGPVHVLDALQAFPPGYVRLETAELIGYVVKNTSGEGMQLEAVFALAHQAFHLPQLPPQVLSQGNVLPFAKLNEFALFVLGDLFHQVPEIDDLVVIYGKLSFHVEPAGFFLNSEGEVTEVNTANQSDAFAPRVFQYDLIERTDGLQLQEYTKAVFHFIHLPFVVTMNNPLQSRAGENYVLGRFNFPREIALGQTAMTVGIADHLVAPLTGLEVLIFFRKRLHEELHLKSFSDREQMNVSTLVRFGFVDVVNHTVERALDFNDLAQVAAHFREAVAGTLRDFQTVPDLPVDVVVAFVYLNDLVTGRGFFYYLYTGALELLGEA